MRNLVHTTVGLVVGLGMGACGTAAASGVFDSSTPPTPTGWMTRPCKDAPLDGPRLQNCYWNNTMGLTDGSGNDIDSGFWIWKVPNQPLKCWIYSPDDEGTTSSHCYTVAKRHTH